MNLKVIGAGCPECDKLYTNTLEAVEAAAAGRQGRED